MYNMYLLCLLKYNLILKGFKTLIRAFWRLTRKRFVTSAL